MTAVELRAWAGDTANDLLERIKLSSSIVRPVLHAVAKRALIVGFRKGVAEVRSYSFDPASSGVGCRVIKESSADKLLAEADKAQP
jgi:hypothetical protein